MAQKRIELRITPINHDEKALVDALDALGDEYGAKGRFLKARLLRGYVAIMREVESIKQESDPLAALDRLAQSVNSGHYRVLRALLYERTTPAASAPVARPTAASPPPAAAPSAPEGEVRAPRAEVLAADPVPAPVAELPAAVVEAQAAPAEPHAAQERPDPVGGNALLEGDAGSTSPAQEAQGDASAPDHVKATEEGDSAADQSVPVPPPAHNWSRFAGMAGKRGA